MAHKAMIDGKAYEVSGGKTMVGGKVYSIANGKTLVGGKAYEIAFGGDVLIVEITSKGNGNFCRLWINGSSYTAVGTYEFPIGTEIWAQVRGKGSSVYYNGQSVLYTGTTTGMQTYKFVPATNYVSVSLTNSEQYNMLKITDK